MPICNRDLDVSEQTRTFQAVLNGTPSGVSAGVMNPGLSTGQTFRVCTIPYPAQLTAVDYAVWGLSGAPVHSLWLYRFAGGFTAIAVGQTMAVTAFGTSGVLGVSLFGASWQLLAGDQIVLYTQAANTAVAESTVTVCVKALQDIKNHFGV